MAELVASLPAQRRRVNTTSKWAPYLDGRPYKQRRGVDFTIPPDRARSRFYQYARLQGYRARTVLDPRDPDAIYVQVVGAIAKHRD